MGGIAWQLWFPIIVMSAGSAAFVIGPLGPNSISDVRDRATTYVTSKAIWRRHQRTSHASNNFAASAEHTFHAKGMREYLIRPCRGGEDYEAIICLVNSWWGGRRMSPMLPRLFFEHFSDTTFVAVLLPAPGGEHNQDEAVVGFLCGFVSQSRPKEAHTHFIGVDPQHSGSGIGRVLYERFFTQVRRCGCKAVHAVTSPRNAASIAFHVALDFQLQVVGHGEGDIHSGFANAQEDCSRVQYVPSKHVHVGWDGPDDGDRVLFEKVL